VAFVNQPPADAGGSVLQRLSDAELIEVLVQQGFTGDEWRAAEAVLVATAIGVLHDLLLGGGIGGKSVALDRPLGLTGEEISALRDDADDRVDLVHAAVVDGIRVFRKLTLEGRGWREDGGASLRSYVVNGCVLALANPVRVWRTRRSRDAGIGPVQDAADALASPEPDALARLLAEEDWRELLGTMPPPLALAMQTWRLTGEPWIRIAARIGISERSLEGLLHRWRKNHRPQREETP
jgi:DNA-directed RNA polymerase specialized sigma24 family protein